MRHDDFELAGGGVIGRDHHRSYGNYQDSFLIHQNDDCTIAIVTDGCGSSPYSEVGAQMGAHFVAKAVLNRVRRRTVSRPDWEYTHHEALNSVLDAVRLMEGGSVAHKLEDYFLFTVVGVVLAEETATFFALGDGVVIVNGELLRLGPFPGNQPPYLAYGFKDEDSPQIEIVKALPLSELDNFLIGTDGVNDLIAAESRKLPGLEEPVGLIDQFWVQSRYFSGNPDLISRRLRLAARDWPKNQPQAGLLHDDTTLITGRRRPITD